MEIWPLGTGSGMPSAELDSSFILLRSSDHCYLYDAGEGAAKKLMSEKINPNEPDAIVITHLHPDHVCGVFMLIQMMYLSGRNKALPIYLPERHDEFLGILKMLYTFPTKFSFELSFRPIESLSHDFEELSIQPNDHLVGYSEIIRAQSLPNRQKAFSLKVDSPEGAFVYSSDLTTTDSIANFCSGAHTILVDSGHPDPQQILQLKDWGIKRILLTHECRKETLELLGRNPDNRFEEVIQGKKYYI